MHSVSLLFKDICDVYIYKDISTAEVCSIKWTVIGYINVKDKFGEMCQEVIMFLNKNKLCLFIYFQISYELSNTAVEEPKT